MSSPNHVHSLDSEDEHHDLPTSVDETLPFVTEEEEPSEEEPMEEEPSEEEPEETGPHPVSPVPSVSPDTQPRFEDIRRLHESYFPPSPPHTRRLADTRRWEWVPETLAEWRRIEGSPFSESGESSSTAARSYPVTEEPPLHTLVLLVARLLRHDQQLEQLQNDTEAIPPPEVHEEMEQEIDRLGTGYRQMSRFIQTTSVRVADHDRRISNIERRFDEIEATLHRLFAWERIGAEMAVSSAASIYKGPLAPK